MVQLILTCEHGGYGVPAEYRELFRDAKETLQSHRGWDPGADELAHVFKRRLNAPLISNSVTRLLVELNRSIGHRRLFSEFTEDLDQQAKTEILSEYYVTYRDRVEDLIRESVSNRVVVVHVSVHTFVPVLNGQTRTADVGLLYDPCRSSEKQICQTWQSILKSQRPDLRIRRNYPYLGKSDGFTTYLRRQFSAKRYAGIELEVNQRWLDEAVAWRTLARDLCESLRDVLANF